MFPTNVWVFLSLSIDNALNTQYGFRNVYNGGVETQKYASNVPSSGSLYSISPTTSIYWGGDTSNKICNCAIQYVRLYIDYAASSQDEMKNLALMNPASTLLFSPCYQDLNYFFFINRQAVLPAFPKFFNHEQQPNHRRGVFYQHDSRHSDSHQRYFDVLFYVSDFEFNKENLRLIPPGIQILGHITFLNVALGNI